jgi:hypothetical protein
MLESLSNLAKLISKDESLSKFHIFLVHSSLNCETINVHMASWRAFLVYQEWRKGPTVWDLLKGFPELFFTQSMFMFRILKVEMTSKKKSETHP